MNTGWAWYIQAVLVTFTERYIIGKRGWKVNRVFRNTDNKDKLLCLRDTKQSIIGEYDLNINVYPV